MWTVQNYQFTDCLPRDEKFLIEGRSTMWCFSPMTNTLYKTALWLWNVCATHGGCMSWRPLSLKIIAIWNKAAGISEKNYIGHFYPIYIIHKSILVSKYIHKYTCTLHILIWFLWVVVTLCDAEEPCATIGLHTKMKCNIMVTNVVLSYASIGQGFKMITLEFWVMNLSEYIS
jgi:hypothetical protein